MNTAFFTDYLNLLVRLYRFYSDAVTYDDPYIKYSGNFFPLEELEILKKFDKIKMSDVYTPQQMEKHPNAINYNDELLKLDKGEIKIHYEFKYLLFGMFFHLNKIDVNHFLNNLSEAKLDSLSGIVRRNSGVISYPLDYRNKFLNLAMSGIENYANLLSFFANGLTKYWFDQNGHGHLQIDEIRSVFAKSFRRYDFQSISFDSE